MLADLSPMLASLISGLIRSPDVEVIAGRPGADLQALVAESAADVVILPGDVAGLADAELPDAGRRLLDDRARFRVLALADHARSGVLGELDVRTMTLEDISKEMLRDAVAGSRRGAVPAVSPPSEDPS